MQKSLAMKAAAAVMLGSLALAGCTTTPDKPENASTSASKRQSIDASVNATLSRLYSTVPGSRELVAKSRGTLVFPNVLQAGFIVGGQSGNGALRVGGSTVGYYNTSSLSVGLQAGAQSKAIVFLFMTQEALDEFRLVAIVVDLAIDEIPELVRARQVVDRDDARLAALVERLDDVRADKTGCAGDDEGHDRPA